MTKAQIHILNDIAGKTKISVYDKNISSVKAAAKLCMDCLYYYLEEAPIGYNLIVDRTLSFSKNQKLYLNYTQLEILYKKGNLKSYITN